MSLTIRRATAADEGVLVAFNAALAWETEHKRLRPEVLMAGLRAVLLILCSNREPATTTAKCSSSSVTLLSMQRTFSTAEQNRRSI